MTDTPTDPAPQPRVSIRQIADLLTWARRLAEQSLDVNPRERAAFQRTKADLLARLSDPDHAHPDHPTEGGED